ncbi:MAG: glycosyltransferase family 2 protein [Alphaproteobacteria bacterium]|nr:glycosyltransferase family 2 protein [Alphaproteobacteria bacterium]
MRDVVICIPTYKRPQSLKRLLTAIAALKTAANVTVLVADNDADGHAGFDLANATAPAFRFPLRAVIAPQRGIAQVRNALIAEALQENSRFFAMIDDDEWPDAGWLDAFLRAAKQTGAGVLQGSILFHHPAQADIVRASGPTDMLQGAGNLLIRRDVLVGMAQPWFDPAFALSGGEDRDFFVRLARAGVAFAWANEARCFGDVPESRASLYWMLARAYSIGNSDMRVLLKHHSGLGLRSMELGKIAAALLLTPPTALLLAATPRRLQLLEKLFRALGKLAALCGRHHQEYAVIHGK